MPINTNNSSWKRVEFWGQTMIILLPPWLPSLLAPGKRGGRNTPATHTHTQFLSRPPASVDPATAAGTQQLYTSNKAPMGQILWCQPKFSITEHSPAKPAVLLSFSEPWAALRGIAAFHMECLIKSSVCHGNCNRTVHFWCDKLYLEWKSIALWAEKQTKQWSPELQAKGFNICRSCFPKQRIAHAHCSYFVSVGRRTHYLFLYTAHEVSCTLTHMMAWI